MLFGRGILLYDDQTAPPQRYNRSVGSALWNAVTSARNQLEGVKIGGGKGGKSTIGSNGNGNSKSNSTSGSRGGGGSGSGHHLTRDKDAAGDDRKLRAVHGEGRVEGGGKEGGIMRGEGEGEEVT